MAPFLNPASSLAAESKVGTPGLASQTTERSAPSRAAQKKWVGRGTRDACGNSWAIELTLARGMVTGEFWLSSIKYDITGFLDPSGKMVAIPARKSKFYRNHVGPREMEFSVTFGAAEAKGEHYFSYGRCLTVMRLFPSDK
jgi:hypothetical protein